MDNEQSPSLDLKSLKALSVLGRGAKGIAFLVQTSSPPPSLNETLALKAISKTSVEDKNKKNKSKEEDEYRRIWFERDVLNSLHHPLLPKLHGFLVTEKIVAFAIQYCSGGNLNTLRKKQTEKMFSDDTIRFYAAELVLALEYLHGLAILYRDLKPENVLIQENGHLMLVDFDLSTKISVKSSQSPPIPSTEAEDRQKNAIAAKKKRFHSFLFCKSRISRVDSVSSVENRGSSTDSTDSASSKSNSFVGTEDYVAPEVILGNGHDFAVDWWGLGVLLYEMLYGKTPFRGCNRKETFYRIVTKSPDLVGEKTHLRDLIGRLLEKEPAERISGEGIKGHEFFRGVDWEMVMEISRPPFIPVEEEGLDENKGIDVEGYVESVFRSTEGREKSNYGEKGVSVDNLNNNNNYNVVDHDFSIF